LQLALTLFLLAPAWVLMFSTVFDGWIAAVDRNVSQCETGTVIVEKDLLWRTRVTHFRFDKHETINVPVETAESELKNVELIVKHKTIYEHLYE